MLREHRENMPIRDQRKSPSAAHHVHNLTGNGGSSSAKRHHSRSPEARGPAAARHVTSPSPRTHHNSYKAHHRESPRTAGHGHRGASSGAAALDDIASLLLDSGVAPAQVLQYSSSFLNETAPTAQRQFDRHTGSGPVFHDPVPESLRMLDGTWGTTGSGADAALLRHQLQQQMQQQEQQQQLLNQYVWRLEHELAEVTEQQSSTWELLYRVTAQKDIADLVIQELYRRQLILQDAEDERSFLSSRFRSREMVLREAKWRQRAEQESLRASLVEERLHARERELVEVRSQAERAAAAATADLAALRQQQEQRVAQQLSSVVRGMLHESNEKIEALVDSVPVRVRTVLQESGQSKDSLLSASRTPGDAANTNEGALSAAVAKGLAQLEEDVRATITTVLQEQLAGMRRSETPSPIPQPSPASPASASPSSPVAQQLFSRHQSLLFNKVAHVLGDVEDVFAKALFDKSSYVTEAFLSRAASQAKTVEKQWCALLDGKREEMKSLREELLSLRTQQRQHLWHGTQERTTSRSPPGVEGSAPFGVLNPSGSAPSLGASVSSTHLALSNPAYEPFAVPYIPPALKATKAPVKQSLQKLKADALKAGARPAEEPVSSAALATSGPSVGIRTVKRFSGSRSPSATASSSSSSSPSPSPVKASTASVKERQVESPGDDVKAKSAVSAKRLGAVEAAPSSSLPLQASTSGLMVKTFQRRSPSLSSSSSSASSRGKAKRKPLGTKSATAADGPMQVTVQTQRVAVVGEAAAARRRSTASDDASGVSPKGPPVIEAVMNSKASDRIGRSPHAFDDASSSSSSSIQRGGQAVAAPAAAASAKAAASPSPAAATPPPATAAPTQATPAKKGLQSLSSLLMSSSAVKSAPAAVTGGTTGKPSAILNSSAGKPATAAKPPSRAVNNNDDDDTLSLTLTTSSDGNSPVAAGGRQTKRSNTFLKTISPENSPETPPLGKRVGGTAAAVKPSPAVKRSAFDDDEEVKPPTVKGAGYAKVTSPLPSTAGQMSKAPSASSAKVVPSGGNATPATAAAAVSSASASPKLKSISLPW